MFPRVRAFIHDLKNPPLYKMGGGIRNVEVVVTAENHLHFDGKEYNSNWTKADLEKHLKQLLQMIAESGHSIEVQAISIEFAVAAGLWKEGSLTLDMLRNSVYDDFGTIIVSGFSINEGTYSLHIKAAQYYEYYQFIVKGHPNGMVVVRDVPDALGMMDSSEKYF